MPAVAQPLPPSDGPQPRGSGPNERERGVRADGKEREMLQRELEQLTADLSFQRMRNDWETVCQELRSAIKKLDKLLRRIKARRLRCALWVQQRGASLPLSPSAACTQPAAAVAAKPCSLPAPS